MTDQNDWIKNFLPEEDINQLSAKAEKIISQDSEYYEMSVMMTQADMLDAVRAGYGMRMGDPTSWMIGTSVLMSLLSTMEYALKRDNVDIWEE
jgi:hypothetical protein